MLLISWRIKRILVKVTFQALSTAQNFKSAKKYQTQVKIKLLEANYKTIHHILFTHFVVTSDIKILKKKNSFISSKRNSLPLFVINPMRNPAAKREV